MRVCVPAASSSAGTYQVVTCSISRLWTPKVRATDLGRGPTRHVCARGPPVCPTAEGARENRRPQDNLCLSINRLNQVRSLFRGSDLSFVPAWRRVLEFRAMWRVTAVWTYVYVVETVFRHVHYNRFAVAPSRAGNRNFYIFNFHFSTLAAFQNEINFLVSFVSELTTTAILYACTS